MRPSGRSSQDLARKVFLNGLAFFAVMLALSATIAWHLSQVSTGSIVIVRSFEYEAGFARALGALERLAAAERDAMRGDDPKALAAYRAAYSAFATAATRLGGDPAGAQRVVQTGEAWHRAGLAGIGAHGGGATAPLEQAARQALVAYEDAALAPARQAAVTMEPQIRTAWRLGGLRAVLAIAFFVLLGWRQHRLLSGAFDAYIEELRAKNLALERQSTELEAQRHQVDELAKALAIQNEELERRVQERTRQLAEARDHAQQANDAKSAFLANFSHEMRTPLNAIIGYSDLLVEELEPQAFEGKRAAVADIQRIRGAGRHLLALIDDVLDLAKIEAGKMEPLLEPVDLREMVADVADVARPLAAKRGNDLIITLDATPDPVVTDLKMLRQSLFNLISNACKFTEHGRIELAVRQAAGQLTCTVTDTGIGMTEDQVARLFQDYSQADASITRKYGGTGLGLAISQRFCRLLGGELVVQSELGRGSSFTLRVPVSAPTLAPIFNVKVS